MAEEGKREVLGVWCAEVAPLSQTCGGAPLRRTYVFALPDER